MSPLLIPFIILCYDFEIMGTYQELFFFLQTLSFFLWNLYLKFCFLELRLQKQKLGWIYHNTLENFPYIDSSIAGWVIAVSFINHRVLFLKNTEFQVWPNFSIDLGFFLDANRHFFKVKTVVDGIKFAAGLVSLATLIDVPHLMFSQRNIVAFIINHLHNAVTVTTMAACLIYFSWMIQEFVLC